MTFQPHPQRPDWKVGDEADPRDPPPEAPEDDMRALYGCAPGDWEPRLYLVPTATPHTEIIEFFEVGTASAVRHGWGERDTLDLVTSTLNRISEVVPGSIELATSSKLRFRFWRQMRTDELEEIERIYRNVDDYQAGLERYINQGLSGSSLLHDVGETGVLHLLWL